MAEDVKEQLAPDIEDDDASDDAEERRRRWRFPRWSSFSYASRVTVSFALIAAMTGAPVVPAAILGPDKIFANGGFLPKLTILVGEPMHFTGDRKDKAQLEAFSQSILDEIARMKQTI